MKVLHIGSELSWRGGEQQQYYLLKALGNKLENIVGCCPNSEMEKKCQQDNISYHLLGFGGAQIKSALSIKKICELENIDLIHCHTARAHGAAYKSAALFGNPTPIIVSKRTDFPVKNSYFGKLKYQHKSIRKILCVSQKISQIVKSGIDRPEIVQTVYSGVDLERFNVPADTGFRERYGLSKDDILVGNTSAISDHKDYFTFLKVAKVVTKGSDKVKFLMIGDGPMKDEIMKFHDELALGDKVIFTGFIKNIPNVLPQLDLFFMPSKEEGLGTSLLDAMICKIPVVSTQAGGIPEIVIDGKTGLCGEVGNVSILADMINKLLADKETRERLVNNAYDMVKNNFDYRSTAEKTLKVYQEVLAEKS